MKKVCASCGKELKAAEIYCSSCGAKYEEPVKEEVKETVKPEPVTVTVNNTAPAHTSDLSVGGFVLSLIGFLCCCGLPSIIGLVLSIVGLSNINNGKCPNGNKGLAIAGIILGSISILFSIVGVIFSGSIAAVIDEVVANVNY